MVELGVTVSVVMRVEVVLLIVVAVTVDVLVETAVDVVVTTVRNVDEARIAVDTMTAPITMAIASLV